MIRERLARLEAEKAALEARLADIEAHGADAGDMPLPAGPVTGRSPARDKIALFRSLFRGREDVYPKRWDNTAAGKSGYAPVCANEWAPRICGKPRIKCGACPNQAFREVTDEAIDGHLIPAAAVSDSWGDFLKARFLIQGGSLGLEGFILNPAVEGGLDSLRPL